MCEEQKPEASRAPAAHRRHRLQHMNVAFLFLLGGLLLLALSHRLWLPLIGGFLIVAEPLQPVDAVVPLAGNVERVEYAAKLYQDGFATWFVATSMPHHTPGIRASYSTLVSREAMWQGVPEGAIVQATTVVSTTYEEALAVRDLAQQQQWDSLLVVSSPSHTRRARWIFRDVFAETSITIIVHPVEDHWYTPDSWWQRQDGLRITWTEYLKFGLYIAGYH
jgi:uncharacterized SAM-binding protein YcdF (DUF218 family)